MKSRFEMMEVKDKTSEKKLVPKLRFGEFEGEILESLFGDHYTFHTTNSLSRDKLNYESGEVRNVHYGDIHKRFNTLFVLGLEHVPFINQDQKIDGIKEESFCQVGDLIIADASEDYSDIGKSIEIIDLNNEKVLAGLHTFLARPSSGSTALGYISYALKSWKLRKQIMTIAQGTKVLSLSTNRVAQLKLNLPTLPEQKKIASFLSAVDEKIQQLSQKKSLLEQYKKGVMQKLFSQEVRFSQADGSDFPEWEEKRLGEVGSFYSGGTPSSSNKDYYSGSIPFIGSGNIYDSEVVNFITEEALLSSSAKLVEKGDLLYALYGANSGESAISKISGAINQAILCIKPKGDTVYLNNLLVHNKERIVAKFLQGGQGNLSGKIIRNLKYPFPTIQEQQKIATFLSSIDTKIEQTASQLEQAQKFKKGLLQQMFV